MKKILVILWILILSCNTLACKFHNGQEYTKKDKIMPNAPNAMEFFSFFCPYCYEFEKKHDLKYLKKNNFKKNINIEKYHVNFLGRKLSPILTKSWIIAQQMGIEKKIILPIFKGIQETHTINNIDSIKKIFQEEAGINENEFNSFWNSLTLKILVHKKNKEVKESNVNRVPTMLIKGKYIIDYSKIEKIFKNDFSKKYFNLIQFLINKK